MKIDFKSMEEKVNPGFKGGEGSFITKIVAYSANKIISGRLEPGSSIGWHQHETSSEIIYILEGEGKCIVEGGEERLSAGDCHYCKKGEFHSLVNDGDKDLVIFAVVPEQ